MFVWRKTPDARCCVLLLDLAQEGRARCFAATIVQQFAWSLDRRRHFVLSFLAFHLFRLSACVRCRKRRLQRVWGCRYALVAVLGRHVRMPAASAQNAVLLATEAVVVSPAAMTRSPARQKILGERGEALVKTKERVVLAKLDLLVSRGFLSRTSYSFCAYLFQAYLLQLSAPLPHVLRPLEALWLVWCFLDRRAKRLLVVARLGPDWRHVGRDVCEVLEAWKRRCVSHGIRHDFA